MGTLNNEAEVDSWKTTLRFFSTDTNRAWGESGRVVPDSQGLCNHPIRKKF